MGRQLTGGQCPKSGYCAVAEAAVYSPARSTLEVEQILPAPAEAARRWCAGGRVGGRVGVGVWVGGWVCMHLHLHVTYN